MYKDAEGAQTSELCVLTALVGKGCEGADELGELDLLILVLIKDAQQTAEKGILAQLGDRLKLVCGESSAAITIKLLEPPVESPLPSRSSFLNLL